MSHHCKTCTLDFTTSSNLRKHERTEKHLAKCQLLTMVEPTTSDQKIKELEEKLAKAEQTILLQTQLIQSYQVIVQLTGLPDPMLPEVVLAPVSKPISDPIPEPVPKVVEAVSVPKVEIKVKKMRKYICMPNDYVHVFEPEPVPIFDPIPEPVPEPEVVVEPIPQIIPEPVSDPIPAPVPVKPKSKKVKTEEELAEETQARIECLNDSWNDLETTLSFEEIQQEIKSFEPRNETEKQFKDSYYKRFAVNYIDRRPKQVPEPELEQEPEKPRRKLKIVNDPKNLEAEIKPTHEPTHEQEPEKPRRKLKIVNDPPKNLEAEVFKLDPKPEPESEKPRRKLKIIDDPPKTIS